MLHPRHFPVSVLVFAGFSFASAADPAKPTDLPKFAGVWLAEAADGQLDRPLSRVWFSKFTVEGNTFRVSKLMTHPKDLTGTLTLDSTTNPKSIDLKVDELDFSTLGIPARIPAATLRGIYKFDRDRLVVCLPLDAERTRPTEFSAAERRSVVLRLGRANPTFKELPDEVTVTVKDPHGRPVPKATTFYHMHWSEPRDPKAGPPAWTFTNEAPTGPDGTVRIKYAEVGQGIRAWEADCKLIGFAPSSPFALQEPVLTVTLEPVTRLTGTMVCEEFRKAGLPIGRTNVTLYHHNTPVASYAGSDGKFAFPVPAGEYVIEAYGSDLHLKKLPVRVSAGRTEFVVPPISMSAAALPLLKGKRAPELAGVFGWKGEKISLAGLEGKYVLLEFWGYWCGPCVVSMPVLFELHDRFKDKGLAVVGVHMDADGDVDTTAKLDEKLADIRKALWKGRDLPFPVALCSGKPVDVGGGETRRRGPAVQYGVVTYPTTILIDRDGKVVGRFQTRDTSVAVQAVEKLLAGK